MSEGKVIQGDCLEVLREMEDNSVDAVVCDPPYGLSNTNPGSVADTIAKWVGGDRDHVPTGRGFMGKSWDAFVPPPAVWDECLRVLKPGGHMVVFAGSRTQDLMGLSIRLAGFEIRDSLAWLYGSGFPKSHDVSKAIDKLAGAEREVIGSKITGNAKQSTSRTGEFADGKHGGQQVVDITAPATPEAAQWDGWGTALKPGHEPVVVARKPLAEKTVARNVLAHGTGAINVDACRIAATDSQLAEKYASVQNAGPRSNDVYGTDSRDRAGAAPHEAGRFPANVLLDQHAAAWVDEQSEGASRFFYTAKAPKSERPNVDGVQHATVKPLAIMRWLIRLITPPGGTVLDPFAGSGTTIEAALIEGFDPVGIEMEADYLPLIQYRIDRQAGTLTA